MEITPSSYIWRGRGSKKFPILSYMNAGRWWSSLRAGDLTVSSTGSWDTWLEIALKKETIRRNLPRKIQRLIHRNLGTSRRGGQRWWRKGNQKVLTPLKSPPLPFQINRKQNDPPKSVRSEERREELAEVTSFPIPAMKKKMKAKEPEEEPMKIANAARPTKKEGQFWMKS